MLILKGAYDVYKGPRNRDPSVVTGAQWPVNEPLATVPAMAAATESIGITATVACTYEQVIQFSLGPLASSDNFKPYHLARRLSTVDHLSSGRLGWNVSILDPLHGRQVLTALDCYWLLGLGGKEPDQWRTTRARPTICCRRRICRCHVQALVSGINLPYNSSLPD